VGLLNEVGIEYMTGFVFTLYIFFTTLNQLNAARLKNKKLAAREREELIEKIDRLERTIAKQTRLLKQQLYTIKTLQPLAAKVPMLESQVLHLQNALQQKYEVDIKPDSEKTSGEGLETSGEGLRQSGEG
jgi:hypothetical protein